MTVIVRTLPDNVFGDPDLRQKIEDTFLSSVKGGTVEYNYRKHHIIFNAPGHRFMQANKKVNGAMNFDKDT